MIVVFKNSFMGCPCAHQIGEAALFVRRMNPLRADGVNFADTAYGGRSSQVPFVVRASFPRPHVSY
jgi:hypothetical protein